MSQCVRRGLALVLSCAFWVGAGVRDASAAGTSERNDYADQRFAAPLGAGLRHFYARDFKAAQADFERALAVVPDNTFAISFLNAAALQQGTLEGLRDVEEDAVTGAPTSYANHLRLAVTYLFASLTGRDRVQDARDELNAAMALDPAAPGAHVGLGIMRFNERSANRAKAEFLAALRTDPENVLAREYLGQLYQTDLRDPQRGLTYEIEIPNLVPQYADIDFHLGSLLYDLHQPDTALKYLNQGLALDASHVGEAGQHGYTLVARIDIERHQLTEATVALNAAVAAGVDTIYANTLLRKLKNGDYAGSSGPEKL